MTMSDESFIHVWLSHDEGPDYHSSPTDPVPDAVASTWRRGYYAAVSYMDHNVGRVCLLCLCFVIHISMELSYDCLPPQVLNTLDELGFTNNTIVALMVRSSSSSTVVTQNRS